VNTDFLYSEAHRHECEVRYVLALPPASRRPYLDLVLKKRGEARTLRLVTAVLRFGGEGALAEAVSPRWRESAPEPVGDEGHADEQSEQHGEEAYE